MKSNRRNFLKLLLAGGGFALLSKVFDFNLLSAFDSKKNSDFNVNSQFNIKEKSDKLVFYNKAGNRIFSLDQEGTMEIGEG